jgi:hypothetical protein
MTDYFDFPPLIGRHGQCGIGEGRQGQMTSTPTGLLQSQNCQTRKIIEIKVPTNSVG